MATTRPHGASQPMPRDCATIIISAIRIVENSDNTNTYYNPMSYTAPILTCEYITWQGIYFRIFISFFILLIFAGIFSLASFNHLFIRLRSHLS